MVPLAAWHSLHPRRWPRTCRTCCGSHPLWRRVWGLEDYVHDYRLRVKGWGFKVSGVGFGVLVTGIMV